MVGIVNAGKQAYQLLAQIMNFFPYFGVHNSCKLVQLSTNLDQTSLQFRRCFVIKILAISSPFSHQNRIKRLAAIKRENNNRAVSFSLSVT